MKNIQKALTAFRDYIGRDKNIYGDEVYGDKIGRDKIINYFVGGLSDLPVSHESRVRNFLDYYLGSDANPAPFGGRDDNLDQLDYWLTDPTAIRYLLIAEPAGRGKSALLAHWITRLERRKSVHIVFFPISIRFGTNPENVVFGSLTARLARIFNERLSPATNAQQYRDTVSDYLHRTPPDGKLLLIVLDGLDEAAGWEAGAYIFPQVPPPHLRVIVAARQRKRDWLTQLGWESGKGKLFPLTKLSPSGVSDVLMKMGNPLNGLANRDNIISKLYELSEGDPLLVRLYVDALLPHRSRTAVFSPDDLLILRPGIKPFFDRWFEEQKKLWQAAGLMSAPRDTAINSLLNLCALAKGPLSRDDVLALATNEMQNGATIRWAAEALDRFVLGDGSPENGYVFGHPRFNDYFAEELPTQEHREWSQRFLSYGRQTLADLNDKRLTIVEASPYIVRFYSTHLIDAKAPPAELYGLVSQGWLRAWEYIDGTPEGFLSDVHRACLTAKDEGAPALGQIVRAALCFSSTASISSNFSTELLTAAIAIGQLTPQLALAIGRAKSNPKDRVECLTAISKFVDQETRLRVMNEVLNIVREIKDPDDYEEAFDDIIEHLPIDSKLLNNVLEMAANIRENKRDRILREVITLLPVEAVDLWRRILSMVSSLKNEQDRLLVFIVLVRGLPTAHKDIIDTAVKIAQDMTNAEFRIIALTAVLRFLPAKKQREVVDNAITIALKAQSGKDLRESKANRDRTLWSRVLTYLVRHLTPERQNKVVNIALAVARSIPDEFERAELLCELLEFLPIELHRAVLGEVIQYARNEGNKQAILEPIILAKIAKFLPLDEQRIIIHNILQVLQTNKDVNSFYSILRSIIELQSLSQTSLLTKFAEVIRTTEDFYAADGFEVIVDSMVRHIPHTAEEVWTTVIEIVKRDPDDERRLRLVSIIAKYLPSTAHNLVIDPLNAARIIGDESIYQDIFYSMIENFPADQLEHLFVLLVTLLDQKDDSTLAALLDNFTDRLLPGQVALLRRLFSLALALELKEQAFVIRAISRNTPAEAEDLLHDILEFALKLKDEDESAEILVNLADLLPSEAPVLAEKVLEQAHNSYILCRVAKHFTSNKRIEILHEALLSARKTPNSSEQYIYSLTNVIEALPSESRVDVIREAVAAASSMKPISGSSGLHALARRLPLSENAEVVSAMLSLADREDNPSSRALELLWAVPLLPPEQQETVLYNAIEVTKAIKDTEWHIKALAYGIRNLSHEQRLIVLNEMLTVARDSWSNEYRPKYLCLVAKHISPSERLSIIQEVLSDLKNIDSGPRRLDIFSTLAECLTPEMTDLQLSLLSEACAYRHENESVDILKSLVPYWRDMCVASNLMEVDEVIKVLLTFSDTKREILVRLIAALMPIIARLGGERAVNETAQALLDTKQWWP